MVHVKRRRSPHLDVSGQPQFITFRLFGSLPKGRSFPRASLTSGKAFLLLDSILDEGRFGPTFLSRPEVAECFELSLREGTKLGHYELHSWLIMPNHVHLLLTPSVGLSKLLRSLKSFTARQANLRIGRTGETFWQDESYDHLVRSAEEFLRIQRYIENNPVKAGLVQTPEEYRWSSGRRTASPPQGTALPH